jgi:hypothetical protein
MLRLLTKPVSLPGFKTYSHDSLIPGLKNSPTANTDNMGKLFITLFAFAPALKTDS